MKITIDKDVLDQALEALRYCRATVASVETERRQAIAGLQEALAQPQQEPVGQLQEEAFGRGQVIWIQKPPDNSLLYTAPPACKQSNQPDSVAGYVSKIESLIKERDGLKELLSNSLESGGIKTVEIDRIKHDHHPAFAFRECEDSHAGEPVQPTIAGVPPELFAQQIAAAMRFADAPLSHDQFVTLVLYLKARSEQ